MLKITLSILSIITMTFHISKADIFRNSQKFPSRTLVVIEINSGKNSNRYNGNSDVRVNGRLLIRDTIRAITARPSDWHRIAR